MFRLSENHFIVKSYRRLVREDEGDKGLINGLIELGFKFNEPLNVGQ